ncbi:imidazole glycerol phosphate synthase subunit HisF [Anoxybacter fermentans]|uniref:Imidazole glycerol phosphate synthase subunit HisF n=1 Tax=Anoxybacter fermentans TaxID=1323375 RepID=A0A3Q9HRL5_9FIRM|nr:imidazole glycerol phosphate synthase subunit HisF [Anoxybacter fermentans]AZR74027.1 imidazole glycerol phosphate synthase subunit HisF [Anoxybacter fermentans]
MLTKRIIPCLDVKDGRVVKGVNFKGLVDAGDPVEIAAVYNRMGADELVFLDITATVEGRDTICHVVEEVAAQVFIPLTVGGGIRTVADMKKMLRAGADKVAINSAAVKNPDLITEGARIFGSQCIVVAVDGKKREDGAGWNVYTHGGSRDSGIDLIDWVREVEMRGAGEILLTSIDADGTKKGFDLEMTRAVAEVVNIPVIASGGAGSLNDFVEVLTRGKADAALAASLFHFGELTINQVKAALVKAGVSVRQIG